TLGDEHLWISRSHLPETSQIQGIGLLSTRQDTTLIPLDSIDCRLIPREHCARASPQIQIETLHLALSSVEIRFGGGDVALVAVEDRQRDANLYARLRPGGARVALDGLRRITEAAANDDVGNPLG